MITGFIIGFIVGGIFGVLGMAVFKVGAAADEREEKTHERK
jgi:hypothetical protein